MPFSKKQIIAGLVGIFVSLPQLLPAAVQSTAPDPSQTPGEVKIIAASDIKPRTQDFLPPAILSDMSATTMPRQAEELQKSLVPPLPVQVAGLPKQIEKAWDFVPPATQTTTQSPPARFSATSPLTPIPNREKPVLSSGTTSWSTSQIRIETGLPQSMNIFKPGQFRFTVINDGPVSATGVNLTININGEGRVVSTSPADAVQQANAIYFPVGDLEIGQSREFVFDFQADASGPITVTPQITSSSTNSVSVNVSAPKIAIDISGEQAFVVGQTMTQIITVRNDGHETVQNLVVRQACTPASAFSNAGFVGNSQIIPQLGPGQSAELELSALAVQPGNAELQIAIEGDNVRGTFSKQIEFAQSQLTAQITGPELSYVNSLGTYAITVSNDQQRDMQDVNVKLMLPAGMIVKIVDRKSEFDATASTISWNIPNLAAGGSETIPFKATMSQFGSHVLKASIGNIAGTLTNSQMTTEVVGRADVEIKVNTPSEPIEVGTATDVSVLVQNRGTNQAENVQVTIKLPASLTPIESTDFVIGEAGIQFESFPLAPGQSQTLKIQVKCVTAGDHVVRAEVQSSASSRVIASENSLFFYSNDMTRTAENGSATDR